MAGAAVMNDAAHMSGGAGAGSTGDDGSSEADGSDVSCFGTSTADLTPGSPQQCALERCCGSAASCAKDATCASAFKCASSATSQAQFDACVAQVDGDQNIASRLWFFDFFSCTSANCSGTSLPNPKPADPCEQYEDCSSCLNGTGLAAGGATGNCGWMTDGSCHGGSTAGPDDPAAWGDDLKWTFFDDTACPGGGGSNPGGCTADADCGHCERCERSTGNCLTKLTCN
jgi:hypothetical protein